MDDPVFKSADEGLFRQVEEECVERLYRNLLRIYEWETVQEPVPENCALTTLAKEGFKMVGSAIMRDAPPIMLENPDPGWITEETGGFTRAENTNNPFVNETHQALSAWEHWVPQSARQRTYRDMVVRLEASAKREEDEYLFERGSSAM